MQEEIWAVLGLGLGRGNWTICWESLQITRLLNRTFQKWKEAFAESVGLVGRMIRPCNTSSALRVSGLGIFYAIGCEALSYEK